MSDLSNLFSLQNFAGACLIILCLLVLIIPFWNKLVRWARRHDSAPRPHIAVSTAKPGRISEKQYQREEARKKQRRKRNLLLSMLSDYRKRYPEAHINEKVDAFGRWGVKTAQDIRDLEAELDKGKTVGSQASKFSRN